MGRGLAELDEPIVLAGPSSAMTLSGTCAGPPPFMTSPSRTRRPVRGVPLKLDHNEAVAGEERRRDLDPTARNTLFAQPWEVDLEPGQPQKMQREPFCASSTAPPSSRP